MRRTIGYFTDSEGFGGAEKYLLQIFHWLDLEHWRPVLYYHASTGITPLIEDASNMGVALHEVPPMPLGLKGARLAPAFAQMLREEQPDVFHANLTWPLSCKFGLAAAVLARVPAILATLHSFPQFSIDLPTRIQQRLLGHWIDCYIVVSQALGERLNRAFWIPPAKIHVIYNGVPGAPAIPAPGFAPPVAEDNQPIVFTAARLDGQKGLEYLMQAATLVPQARFVVAGDGPLYSQLKRLTSEYGIEDRVFLVGYQSEIDEWLACADLFVLPSLFEGLPLSILEAMAAGKPVIATQIEGVDEAVIPGETGLLVPPADSAALAQAIQSLLADPAWAAELGRAGKARVMNQFTLESMISKVVDCYESALSGQGEPA